MCSMRVGHPRVESRTSVTDDSLVPLLLDGDSLRLDVGGSLRHLQQLLLDLLELLRLLNRRGRGVGRRGVVDEKDGGLLGSLGREEDQDVLLLVEGLEPVYRDQNFVTVKVE